MGFMKKYISEEEMKTHNKKNDLWISIHGKVYNVTDWVNHHPGGDIPLTYFAGQDVTNPFLAYHPPSASKYLDQFFTGYHLKDYKVSEMSHDYMELFLKFRKMGLFDKKDHTMFILNLISMMMLFLCVYGVIFSDSMWVHLTCAGMLGFSWIQSGWFMHDASHYQAMMNRESNRVALLVLTNCLTGVSTAWWKRVHNAHHISANSFEYDPDTLWIRIYFHCTKYLSTMTSYLYEKNVNLDSPNMFQLRSEHIISVILCALGRPYGYARSIFFLTYKKKVAYRSHEVMGLLVFWVWLPLLMSCLPNWFERITFLAIAFTATGVQHLQFGLNHIACDVYVGPPSASDWVEKQTIGSLNIACSPWMDWFHGGLQFQVEHHLFPRMPRDQLRTISPYVKELCKKYNLTYNCASSFWEAIELSMKSATSVAHEARNSIDPLSKDFVMQTLSSRR